MNDQQPTKFRKKLMSSGDIFSGIKTKDPNQRRKIEIERHNLFMDIQGPDPYLEAGVSPHIRPDTWVDNFVKKNTKEHCEKVIKEKLKFLENDDSKLDPMTKPFFESEMHKKNLKFYKHARNYFYKHYET